MQQPKRVKYRKAQRGRRRGKASSGNVIGFGDYGDDHVRFGLIENEHRTRQAVRGIRQMFRNDERKQA